MAAVSHAIHRQGQTIQASGTVTGALQIWFVKTGLNARR